VRELSYYGLLRENGPVFMTDAGRGGLFLLLEASSGPTLHGRKRLHEKQRRPNEGLREPENLSPIS